VPGNQLRSNGSIVFFMANMRHLALLKEGVEAWNLWKAENFEMQWDVLMHVGRDPAFSEYGPPDLSAADLRGADLNGFDSC
jgi:hypothetical protein